MYDKAYLEDLRDYIFKKTGKYYFNNIKDGKEDILCTCPIHKEGQERHPSCGFSKIDKENISAGWFHCFNCGFTGNTYDVLKQLLGDKYDKKEANDVLGIDEYEEDYLLNSNPIIINIPDRTPIKYVSKKELAQYDYYSNYVRDRGISEQTMDKYRIGLDIRTNEVTFPIRDYTGGTLAVGRRSVVGKRYEYPLGFTKPLYGVYELPVIYKSSYVYVVEGPFNLWTLYEYKKLGVALLGTGTRNQYSQLLTLKCRGFILALDGDAAGRKGVMKLANFLQKYKREVWVADVPDNEDINSMSKEMFDTMGIYTYEEWWNTVVSRLSNSENNQQMDDID